MLRGKFPRSPVWLRKIPSTVSGSQGSRRGLRPAVRFAFPLGARLNITLRARPCQELFSESFSGRPAGRGAPRPPGFCPSRRRVRYYTRPRRPGCGKPARTQDADNSSAAERKGSQAEGGIGLALRPAPHARPPRSPGVSPRPIGATAPEAQSFARPGPPERSTRLSAFNYLYISRRIWLTFRPGVLPPSSRKRSFSCRWRFLIRLRRTSHEANTSRDCFQRPRAHRRVPSCSRP